MSWLEALLEQVDDAVIATDARGRIVLFNAGAARAFAYAPEDVVDRLDIGDLLMGSGTPPFGDEAGHDLGAGESWQGEVTGARSDRSRIRATAKVSAVFDEGARAGGRSGAPTGRLYLLTDVRAVDEPPVPVAGSAPVRTPSEAEFRLFLDHAPIIATMRDRDGRFIYANASARLDVARGGGAVLGQTPQESLRETAAQAIVETDREVLETGLPLRFERTLFDPDQCYLVIKFPLTDDRGQTVGVGAVATDITELKRAQEALRGSEERFRQIAETIDSGIVFAALDPLEYLYVSPAIARIGSIEPDQLMERTSVLGVVHPDDQARVRAFTENELQPLNDAMECRIVPNGETRWIRLRRMPPARAHDGRRRVAFVIDDITQEREAAAALERSRLATEAALRRLDDVVTASTRHAIIASDARDVVTIFNRGAEIMTGYSAEEVLGRPARELADKLFSPEERAGGLAFTADPDGGGEREWIWVRADGARIHVELAVTPIFDPGGRADGYVAIARDITLAKRQEAQLVEALERAEAADAAKSAFLSRMSHELRTPLNAILGFGQLLSLESLQDEQREYAERIISAGQHLLSLVDEVLDLTRIESGRLVTKVSAVAVDALAGESIDMVAPMANARGLRLETDLQAARATRLHVTADSQSLKQVVLNLLVNAVKYNRPGGKIRLSVTATGQTVRFAVSDTGVGIADDDQARLFEPFVRFHPEEEGSGLGLALCKGLVEQMGGTIGFDSRLGEGSTFWIELPQASPQPQSPDEPLRPGPTPAAPSHPARTVLYIEDNEPNRRLARRVLSKRPDLRLLTAADGTEGLTLARSQRPDLILLDLHLPDIAGEEVLRRLRADDETRRLPIVIVSADANPESQQRMRAQGASDFLVKPYTIGQLIETIDVTLEQPDSDAEHDRTASSARTPSRAGPASRTLSG